MLQLRIVKGPEGVGTQFAVRPGQPLLLGRGADCDVKLGAAGVSKRHARLTALAGSKLEVEDMGSSNGTFVNGFLVKKHVLRPGDTLVIHPYVLELDVAAPEPVASPSAEFGTSGFSPGVQTIETPPMASAPADRSLVDKINDFLSSNVYPLADSLSGRFDVRLLVLAFFVVWSLLIVIFTAAPFSDRANDKVVRESIEVAKLYARQLVRLNQQAVLDQRYRDLIPELDAQRGQTPRVMRSLILDATKAQILAPSELLGRPVPNNFAANAITYDNLRVQMDRQGFAFVSAPIKFRDPDKNEDSVAAVVFVEYDAASARFTLANILDQAASSLSYALLATILFMIFVYRWTEGSLRSVMAKVDEALKRGEIQVAPPVKWPVIAQLCEQISVVLGRAAGAGPGSVEVVGSGDWAESAVAASGSAAAAFTGSLTVRAWNEGMERIVGIRASLAVGADISSASRDVAFESSVRELSAQASRQPGSPTTTTLEFSGRPHTLRMVYADGAYFLTIVEEA